MSISDRMDLNIKVPSKEYLVLTKDEMHYEDIDVINPMPRLTELNKSETYNFKELENN